MSGFGVDQDAWASSAEVLRSTEEPGKASTPGLTHCEADAQARTGISRSKNASNWIWQRRVVLIGQHVDRPSRRRSRPAICAWHVAA
jgi:hypothetical protein